MLERLPLWVVAEQLQLTHRVGGAGEVRAFRWEREGPTLEPQEGNRFRYLPSGVCGGLVELAILHRTGGILDESLTGEVVAWLDERLQSREVWAPVLERSTSLAVEMRGRRWTDGVVEAVTGEHGEFGPNVAEAHRLLDVLGIDRERWSVCMLAYEGEAMLCWIPAVPWLGERVLRKPSGYYGGWTRERARQAIEGGEGGRVYCVDIDGDETHGLPTAHLVLRLVGELAEEGMEARAVVLSSFGHAAHRVKAHLYFVGRSRAESEGAYFRRSTFLEATIARKIETWTDVEPNEKLKLGRDPRALHITRLMRLPGFNKRTSPHAGVLYQVTPGAEVDFDTLIAEQTVMVEGAWHGGTQRVWVFGHRCALVTRRERGSQVEEQEVVLGHGIWPVARTRDVEGGGHGVRFRYRDVGDGVGHDVVLASAWSDVSLARRAAAQLAEDGVRLEPGEGARLVMALGQWALSSAEAAVVETVSRPGWHGEVYVHGAVVHGAEWLWVGPEWRGRSVGTLDLWRDGLRAFGGSPVAMTALGVSLAGPLIALIGVEPFGVHLCGPASGPAPGAVELGAAVWHEPSRSALRPEELHGHHMLGWDGAAFCAAGVDAVPDLQLVDLFEATLPAPIAVDFRRGRRGPRPRPRMMLSVLTSGAVSLVERLRRCGAEGIATVIDVRVEGEEADVLSGRPGGRAAFLRSCHGVAGAAWVDALAGLGASGVERLVVAFDQMVYHLGRELGQALPHGGLRALAAIAVALSYGHRFGLWPCDDPDVTVIRLVEWLVERLWAAPSATAPHETAWSGLRAAFARDPGAFPVEIELESGLGDLQGDPLGVARVEPRGAGGFRTTGRVQTCVVWLERWARRLPGGADVEALLAWAASEGRGRALRADDGQETGWWELDLG